MTNPTYPKTLNLWKRDPETHKLIPGVFEKEEFGTIKNWHFTEKIDGTNVRVIHNGTNDLAYLGREGGGLSKRLKVRLKEIFEGKRKNKIREIFPTGLLILYGEGYGARIQTGGSYLMNSNNFILFAIEYRAYNPAKNKLTSWWLSRDNVLDISMKLGIDIVPLLPIETIEEAIEWVKKSSTSVIADDSNLIAEGIVATSNPIMKFQDGDPIRFKIKHKDIMRINKEGHETK